MNFHKNGIFHSGRCEVRQCRDRALLDPDEEAVSGLGGCVSLFRVGIRVNGRQGSGGDARGPRLRSVPQERDNGHSGRRGKRGAFVFKEQSLELGREQ